MIITIDGPVATGKSTIAKKLASSLGYIYFDTGAMYRAVALELLNQNLDANDTDALHRLLDKFDFRIRVLQGERRYFVGENDVTDKIRSEKISQYASQISSNPFIREKLVALQRISANGVNAIFEGRDMGTVVFPNADLKIFLTGRDDVRGQRRYEQIVERFPEEKDSLTMEKVIADMKERDDYDQNREISPLRKADTAFEIDTSDLSTDEVVFKILECRDLAALKRKSTPK